MTYDTKKKMAPPDAELRAKIKRCGEVLTTVVDRLGWDTARLARETGYTQGFVRGTMSGTQWGLPSRAALAYMLDVMGADKTAPEIVEVLGWCPNRLQASGKVKHRMAAFYGRTPGVKYVHPEPVAAPAAATPPAAATCTATRQRAVDSIIEDLVALIEVDERDVVDWVKAHAHDINESTRYEIMRALWAG